MASKYLTQYRLRAAFVGVTGDLKWLKEAHNFSRSYDRIAVSMPHLLLSGPL